jgi:hypothetical protein
VRNYFKCHYLGQSKAISFFSKPFWRSLCPLLGPIEHNHFLFQALLEITILCIFTLQSKLHAKVLCNVYKSSFFGFCFCILKFCKTCLCMYPQVQSPNMGFELIPISIPIALYWQQQNGLYVTLDEVYSL